MIWLAVALAGAAGAVSRFLVDHVVSARVRTELPTGTIVVNGSGALAAGLVAGLLVAGRVSGEFGTVVAGGYLGAYTTFSTAMYETVMLGARRGTLVAVAEVVGQSLLALLGAGAGWVLATWLVGR